MDHIKEQDFFFFFFTEQALELGRPGFTSWLFHSVAV